jgi:hypothetical protein
MRWLGWLLVLLILIGWAASELPPPGETRQPERPIDCWRRTRDGWERASWLLPPVTAHRPSLHPAVVGLFEMLLSIAALLALSPGPKRSPDHGSRRNCLSPNHFGGSGRYPGRHFGVGLPLSCTDRRAKRH